MATDLVSSNGRPKKQKNGVMCHLSPVEISLRPKTIYHLMRFICPSLLLVITFLLDFSPSFKFSCAFVLPLQSIFDQEQF